jgi:hypothetical protein
MEVIPVQTQDFDFFYNNMENLYETYGHKFLAIKDREILGSYNTFDVALESTLKNEKVGTFIIQECFAHREDCVNNFQGNVMFSSA